jgi:hypothetical protein
MHFFLSFSRVERGGGSLPAAQQSSPQAVMGRKRAVLDETTQAWYAAAMGGDLRVLRQFWDNAWVSTLELCEGSGWTALVFAAWYGHRECLAQLIEWGGDKEATDVNGWTPYHHACYGGHAECVALLVEKGCDVCAREARGKSGRDLATEQQQQLVLSKLAGLGVPERDAPPPSVALRKSAPKRVGDAKVEGRGKKPREKKPAGPPKPKRPLSAYMCFVRAARPGLLLELPELRSSVIVSQTIAPPN